MPKLKTRVCPKCNKKIKGITAHNRFSHPVVEIEEKSVSETTPDPVEPMDDNLIYLRFKKNVEIYINGVPYLGKDIKVKGMPLASEIVRMAKEAYGFDVLV